MALNDIFTSESVAEGHPDKLADQISDAILDELLTQDPFARVACETLVKNELVILAGEITTHAKINAENIARQVVREVGYDDPQLGLTANSCVIHTFISKQSADIAIGVDETTDKQLGAGDQGLMFGYATNETDVLMPAPITYAHRLMQQQATTRKNRQLPWLGPDAKCQITLHYEQNKPIAADTIVFSTQHSPDIHQATLQEAVIETIIKPIMPAHWLQKTRFLINPTGRFVIGGPVGDCGLTGRKIIVDTYGGMAHHGGGCFSGKDPSKVDRSAAYAARYVAKNIVAAGLADRCEIQVAYAIGVAEPVSIHVDTFGTGKIEEDRIIALIRQHFDLTPKGIIHTLNLLQPIYKKTACYGHFGRTEPSFTWEKINKVDALIDDAFPKIKMAAKS